MNIESNLSGHWTDEQLIEHIYGIAPQPEHLEKCSYCRERVSAMVQSRRLVETEAPQAGDVPFDLLAAQRRSIYARLENTRNRRFGLHVTRWAAAGAMVALLGGATFLYEQQQRTQALQSKVTDAELVQQISQIANDSEPSPTAPLQALFDE